MSELTVDSRRSRQERAAGIASVAVFAALIVALGAIFLPLPFSAVPVTGQTLGVLLAANLLPPRRAVAAVALVLALGALGLPVIAGGRGGIGVLVGPSAGYFAGWLLVAVGVGAAAQRLPTGSYRLPARIVLNCTLGVLLVYLTGVPWLSFLTQRPLMEAVLVGALPFLPGDLFKAAVAAVVAHRLAGVPVRSVLRVPAQADSR